MGGALGEAEAAAEVALARPRGREVDGEDDRPKAVAGRLRDEVAREVAVARP